MKFEKKFKNAPPYYTGWLQTHAPMLIFFFNFRSDMPLTTEQRVEIILLSGRDGATNRSVAEQFNRNHSHKNVSHTSVDRLINKFRETGSVLDKKRSGRPGLSAETRAQVLEKITSSPRKSV